jgi:hypothetical protein
VLRLTVGAFVCAGCYAVSRDRDQYGALAAQKFKRVLCRQTQHNDAHHRNRIGKRWEQATYYTVTESPDCHMNFVLSSIASLDARRDIRV